MIPLGNFVSTPRGLHASGGVPGHENTESWYNLGGEKVGVSYTFLEG